MFSILKTKRRSVNECRSWRCKSGCNGCKLENVQQQNFRYKLEAVKSSRRDYREVVEAVRSVRHIKDNRWNPDVLGVYKVASDQPDTWQRPQQTTRLYFGMQKNKLEDFLLKGFSRGNSLANCSHGQVVLNNSSFSAVSYFLGDSRFKCDCVNFDNEVVYVILCDVISPPEAPKKMVRYRNYRMPTKDRSFSDRCSDNEYFPAKMLEDPRGLQICDEYLVGEKMVKPSYLVAVRFIF